jgi:hypothetical protein
VRAGLRGNSAATLRQSGERRKEAKKLESEGPEKNNEEKKNDVQKPYVWNGFTWRATSRRSRYCGTVTTRERNAKENAKKRKSK